MCARRPPASRTTPHGLAAAGFEFEGAVRAALHGGKYRGDRAALRLLAAVAVPRLRARLPLPAAVTCVPLGRRRLRSRGYNQAEEIAGVVATELDCPFVAGLERLRDTPPQSSRDEGERRRNVAGAFMWRGVDLEGARLWLVDDVLTTGATTSAAASALEAAGATRVDVAVVAAVL